MIKSNECKTCKYVQSKLVYWPILLNLFFFFISFLPYGCLRGITWGLSTSMMIILIRRSKIYSKLYLESFHIVYRPCLHDIEKNIREGKYDKTVTEQLKKAINDSQVTIQ